MTTATAKPKIPKLTKRQAAILKFIADSINSEGKPPTLRAIGAHFGINSVNAVVCHVRAIESKGLLSRINGKLILHEQGVPI